MSPPPSSGTTTIIFTFLISFLGVFGAIIFGGILWQRRSRRWPFIEPIVNPSSSLFTAKEKPLLWDVLVEMQDVDVTRWGDLLPLSLQRRDDVHFKDPSPVIPPADEANNFWNHLTGAHGMSWRQLSGTSPSGNTDTTTKDANTTPNSTHPSQVSFLIAMPSLYRDVSSPLQTEYAVGTEWTILRGDNALP